MAYEIIQTPKLGVSFSIKCAKGFGLDWKKTLLALLNDIGVRRFRLMSYWDEIEARRGKYNFKELDWQFKQIAELGGEVSLAIGLRQPRYPECHQPEWAKKLNKNDWQQALRSFLKIVVERYRHHPALVSWQLENEALNRGIGECTDYDRKRLRAELRLVKALDSEHPVVMSLSNTFGLPLRRPRPDAYAISLYLSQYNHEKGYSFNRTPFWFTALRSRIIELVWQRPVFIHEFQAEPWGPSGNASLTLSEQGKSMDANKLLAFIGRTSRLKMSPVDLWGGEWWYWRKESGDSSMWEAAKKIYSHGATTK